MHTLDKISRKIIYGISLLTGLLFIFLLGYIGLEGLKLFRTVSVVDFLFTANWHPTDELPTFGILNMITSSLYVSLLALILAVPVSIGCSIFITFCLNYRLRHLLLAFIDMLAGIPSVIFGFMGLILVVKFFENHLNMGTGECVLAGAIILAIMILPFIITNCSESMGQAKSDYEEASYNLGVSRWYTIRKMILPQTALAVSVSLILAFSRAMGETMAVMMVMGNSKIAPALLGKGETIPALIALEMGSAEYNSPHFYALNACAMILLLILIGCNLCFYVLKQHLGRRHQ